MGKSGEKQKRKLFWRKDKKNASQRKPMLDGNDVEQGAGQVDGGFVPPDGGWGWIVCLTSLWANGTVFGIINTFGIIYVQMREQYVQEEVGDDLMGNGTSIEQQDVSLKTAFIGSMCTGVTFLMCTVSSILSDRIGIRPTAMTGAVLACVGLVSSMFVKEMEYLYLTYGLLLGLGSSMVYSPSLVILGHYFKNRMGLVNGIVSFGSSIFTIALTRILPFLLRSFGIKYTFLFLSGLHAVLILFSLSWKPLFHKDENIARLTLSTESVYQHCDNCCTMTKKFLNVKIWRNKAYVIWVGSLGVALFGYFVPFFHLPKHTEDTFPGEDGSWLILCLSITSGVSRIIFGKLADFKCVSRIKMQQLAFAILGLSTLCIPFSTSFGGLIAISLVMGICDGIFVCLLGPIAFDIVGPGAASQAIGFLLGTFSIPFTVGPPVAGFLYDQLGDYRIAFHVSGAPPILGALLMFFIPKVTQNILQANSEDPDQTPCPVVSDLDLHCLPLSHNKDARLIWVKAEQSFPPVTEAMEFASMSNTDIFSSQKVAKPSNSHMKNGAPSGPVTELQLIRSNDLLYLGSNKDKQANGGLNHASPPKDDNQSLGDSNEIDEPDSKLEKEPMLPVEREHEGNHVKESSLTDNNSVSEKEIELGTRESEKEIKLGTRESEKDMELGTRESSLLEEMSKYLEVNNIPVSDAK